MTVSSGGSGVKRWIRVLGAGSIEGTTHSESEACASSVNAQNSHSHICVLLELVDQVSTRLSWGGAINPDELHLLAARHCSD